MLTLEEKDKINEFLEKASFHFMAEIDWDTIPGYVVIADEDNIGITANPHMPFLKFHTHEELEKEYRKALEIQSNMSPQEQKEKTFEEIWLEGYTNNLA